MLRRRSVHKDMADFNGYTAKRLREMAESFAGLSKAFGGNSEETGLSREDGAAAMEAAAAMVCGSLRKMRDPGRVPQGGRRGKLLSVLSSAYL